MEKIIVIFIALFLNSLWAQAAPVKSEKEEVKTSEGSITETKSIPITDKDSIWKLAFYGFVKTDYVYADKALLSYGRENLNAPNQAKRQVQRDDNQARSNFQLGDSRIGFKSQYGNNLSGVIEMDFIDFSQSSPNVNVRPRLRQAYVVYGLMKNLDFYAGQKWDIFSPLNPETYNIINNLYYNGNTGWIREQYGLAFKPLSEWTISTAVGTTAVNTGASPALIVERNRKPTLAFQIKWQPNSENTIYLSGITASETYSDPNSDPTLSAGKSLYYDGTPASFIPTSEVGKSTKIKRQASGLSIGSEYKPEGGKLRLRWEGNWGKNIGDLNTLSTGAAQTTTADARISSSNQGIYTGSAPFADYKVYNANRTEVISIEERGGWFSFAYRFDPSWEVGMFAGIMQVVNRKQLAPALDTATTNANAPFRDFTKTQAEPANGIWTPALIGRVRESGNAGYNLVYLAQTGIKLYFQHETVQTFYQDPERNRGLLAYIKSVNLNTGAISYQDVRFSHDRSSAKAVAQVFRIGVMYAF